MSNPVQYAVLKIQKICLMLLATKLSEPSDVSSIKFTTHFKDYIDWQCSKPPEKCFNLHLVRNTLKNICMMLTYFSKRVKVKW